MVVKLAKTLNYCLNVCKYEKLVQPNIGLLYVPIILDVQLRYGDNSKNVSALCG